MVPVTDAPETEFASIGVVASRGARMWRLFAAVFVVVVGAVAACRADKTSPDTQCLKSGIGPGGVLGEVILGPALDLEVRDPFGRGQAIGTTAVVRASSGELAAVDVQDSVNILAVYGSEGTFSVRLLRPYYEETALFPLHLSFSSNGCLNMTKIPVTLHLAPGAPALRAITILGAQFLDGPAATAQLVPYFDANPGVSQAVTWMVSDTALATINASGLVTAKCSKSGAR